MKRIYVMAVILLILMFPQSSFALGYDLQDGPPFHVGEKVCRNMSSSEEVQYCLVPYASDAKDDLESTIKAIVNSGVLGSGGQSAGKFELMNEAWKRNMDKFCYDYITKFYFPGSLYKSQSERCVFLMSKQRGRLMRTLFLNESDHLNFLIDSIGLCARDDTEHDCLIRNVDYVREIFDFTTDGIADDLEEDVDDEELSIEINERNNNAILRLNIYRDWLSNMDDLCHDYFKIIYNDDQISNTKALQCELISYEGRSRLMHTLFYQGFRYLEFPEKPQKH